MLPPRTLEGGGGGFVVLIGGLETSTFFSSSGMSYRFQSSIVSSMMFPAIYSVAITGSPI